MKVNALIFTASSDDAGTVFSANKTKAHIKQFNSKAL